MRLKYICYLLLFAILLIGCSEAETEAEGNSEQSDPDEQVEEQPGEEEKAEEKQAEETEDDIAIEPFKAQETEAMMQLSAGEYGESNFDEMKIQEEIAAFPSDLTADDYYTRLLALMAADYRELYEQIVDFDTSFADPNAEPDGNNAVETGAPIGKEVNVAVLLDASGSMQGEIEGKTKMEHAVEAIQSFVSMLPSDVNISLQVYGNEGSSNSEDKALSCASTEIVYELSPYNEEQFSGVLTEIKPAGWTPLAASISATYDDLQANTAETSENIVYIVSDGLETCDGDPIEEAENLNASDYQAVINIIGFDVDDEGQKELKKIADAGSGQYLTVESQQEIEDFFSEEKRKLEKEWIAWQSENTSNYHQAELEKRTQVHDLKNAIYEKVDLDMERLLQFSEYMTEVLQLETKMKLEIDNKIRDRSNAIRTFARDLEYQLTKEISEGAAEGREEVRDKGEEERDNLNNR